MNSEIDEIILQNASGASVVKGGFVESAIQVSVLLYRIGAGFFIMGIIVGIISLYPNDSMEVELFYSGIGTNGFRVGLTGILTSMAFLYPHWILNYIIRIKKQKNEAASGSQHQI